MSRRFFFSRRTGFLLVVPAAFLALPAVRAGINIPSDGSDGAFNPTSSVQIDLAQAVTGVWSDSNAANAGKGIYDAAKWAVVFKYSSVTIPAGVTVTFRNHPSGAPVVWLVQTNATVAGNINLNGKTPANSGELSDGGPGGFHGGPGYTVTQTFGSGHGPGGGGMPTSGSFYYFGGSYATQGGTSVYGGTPGPIYGNPNILPLIGGSGGTGHSWQTMDGGGGGGAILLAAGGTVTITGRIDSNGVGASAGGGSGGGIRIIADTLNGAGNLSVVGASANGPGGIGRIRLEANNYTNSLVVSTTPSLNTNLYTDPVIFPDDTAPRIAITSIGGVPAPADPDAVITTTNHYSTVDVAPQTPVIVRMTATNMPLTWQVVLRVVPFHGRDMNITATKVSGDASSSVWEATINLGVGVSALQVFASRP